MDKRSLTQFVAAVTRSRLLKVKILRQGRVEVLPKAAARCADPARVQFLSAKASYDLPLEEIRAISYIPADEKFVVRTATDMIEVKRLTA